MFQLNFEYYRNHPDRYGLSFLCDIVLWTSCEILTNQNVISNIGRVVESVFCKFCKTFQYWFCFCFYFFSSTFGKPVSANM